MFSCEYTISIRDMVYGHHTDHIAILGYLHESRVKFLKSLNVSELNVDNQGTILIVSEMNIKYKKESFYADKIRVTIETIKKSDYRLIFQSQILSNNDIILTADITTAFITANRALVKVPTNLITNK
ncbi:MAG: acyl-CoA thioesterase [Burkholderiales bacterium]|nr:acyl-CoA thioesterase [Burkholderiales bacterium]